MTTSDKFTKDLLEQAKTFARHGLQIASSAVGYAAEMLRDVEKELKESSDRFKAPEQPAPPTSSSEAPKAS